MTRDPMALATGRARPEPYPDVWRTMRDGVDTGDEFPDRGVPAVLNGDGIPVKPRDAMSPLQLCQEMVATPWQGVVGALLHVRTARAQGHPALWRILRRWPEPEVLVRDRSGLLGEFLRPCGLANQREHTLRVMSAQWLDGVRPERPGDLYGCGKYVSDSYRIFALGDLYCAPDDGELNAFVWWALDMRRRGLPWRW